jgi:hypothetical protein
MQTNKKNKYILEDRRVASYSLLWHIDFSDSFCENVYRWGSNSHIALINEVRTLWECDLISLNEGDTWFLKNTDIGKYGIFEGRLVELDCPFSEDVLSEAEYRGKKVTLNKPFRGGGGKKFSVYVKNDKGNVIKLGFGQVGMRIKTHSPERVRSFLARHNCDNPGPRWKARWWSCNLHRYKKQLGLNFKGRW